MQYISGLFFPTPISFPDTLQPLPSIIQHYMTEEQYEQIEILELRATGFYLITLVVFLREFCFFLTGDTVVDLFICFLNELFPTSFPFFPLPPEHQSVKAR